MVTFASGVAARSANFVLTAMSITAHPKQQKDGYVACLRENAKLIVLDNNLDNDSDDNNRSITKRKRMWL